MSNKNQIDMTEGSILKGLLTFSIPIICSNILQLLFHAADVAVIGRFAGDTSLAAVGSTGSLINLFVNLFIGISVGANVVAAEKQLTQSADKEEDKLTAIKETRKIANMAKKAYCKDKVKWENNAFEKAVFEFENGNLTVRRYQKDNCYWAEVKATIKE